MTNLNYFVTQNGRSRDPNSGRYPLIADPCFVGWAAGYAFSFITNS